ncbi:MAG: SUMF1/EgtB/PvdO family nonheme iron enzyme [Candidatus Competibacteraceae bacterium]|nr:SUMF1/EgtB/PvdO family nonheme iron enzyme [Candidatus Competibacteraceae bacterium]
MTQFLERSMTCARAAIFAAISGSVRTVIVLPAIVVLHGGCDAITSIHNMSSDHAASGLRADRRLVWTLLEGAPAENPSGPETGSRRVFRGGSWNSVAENCRSAVRYRNDPGRRHNGLGFRLARRV